MLSTGRIALSVLSFSFVFMAVNNILCTLFQSVGNGMYSLIISLLRQIIIILPLSYLFSKIYGLNGVWITFIIAESFSTIVSIFLFKKLLVKFEDFNECLKV